MNGRPIAEKQKEDSTRTTTVTKRTYDDARKGE